MASEQPHNELITHEDVLMVAEICHLKAVIEAMVAGDLCPRCYDPKKHTPPYSTDFGAGCCGECGRYFLDD